MNKTPYIITIQLALHLPFQYSDKIGKNDAQQLKYKLD